mmetsp:Transcript_41906/g.82753  ORF Transcript_41906/g.82753 Transcript_41906/m.82753 type:complete len:102 (-) Transcript_41906:1359-1664(-)
MQTHTSVSPQEREGTRVIEVEINSSAREITHTTTIRKCAILELVWFSEDVINLPSTKVALSLEPTYSLTRMHAERSAYGERNEMKGKDESVHTHLHTYKHT